jgi:hypothetical protein
MKKNLVSFIFFLAVAALSYGQSVDPLISKCATNAGDNARYLKDFRIQLGKSSNQNELRFRANMSLWKNTKYRFTMCNAESSKGQLILTIKDKSNKIILSSFDKNSGKIYSFVDFECQKSGIYQISYDFNEGQQGSAVGVVSMIR